MTPEQKDFVKKNNLTSTIEFNPKEPRKIDNCQIKTQLSNNQTAPGIVIKTSCFFDENHIFFSNYYHFANNKFLEEQSYSLKVDKEGKIQIAKNVPLGNNQFLFYRCKNFDDNILDRTRDSINHAYIITKDPKSGVVTKTVDLTIDNKNKITEINVDGSKLTPSLQATQALEKFIKTAEDLAKSDRKDFETEFKNREKPKKTAQLDEVKLNGLTLTGIQQPEKIAGLSSAEIRLSDCKITTDTQLGLSASSIFQTTKKQDKLIEV
jgi:hypothetical protein